MKFVKAISLALAVCMLIMAPAFAADAPADPAVATVNGESITRDQLETKLDQVVQQFAAQGQKLNEEQRNMLKDKVLKRLIDETLLYQKSQKEGISVDESEVEKRFDAIKNRFQNAEQFQAALGQMKMSEKDLKQAIERGGAIQKLIDEKVLDKIEVSEAEKKAFYESNLDQFKEPEQVKASHILIRVSPDAEKEAKAEAMKKIEDIKQKLNEGEDFAELAKKYSEGPTSVKGGDLGFFGRKQMVAPFSEAAFSMKPGEVSDVVETTYGYHLIKVFEKKPPQQTSFEEAEKQIDQFLTKQKLDTAMARYLEDLRKESKIENNLQKS